MAFRGFKLYILIIYCISITYIQSKVINPANEQMEEQGEIFDEVNPNFISEDENNAFLPDAEANDHINNLMDRKINDMNLFKLWLLDQIIKKFTDAHGIQFDPSNNAGFDEINRDKRRLSVFKNVYNQCRVQKRKDKNLCLYLANLYQTVKGFHGF